MARAIRTGINNFKMGMIGNSALRTTDLWIESRWPENLGHGEFIVHTAYLIASKTISQIQLQTSRKNRLLILKTLNKSAFLRGNQLHVTVWSNNSTSYTFSRLCSHGACLWQISLASPTSKTTMPLKEPIVREESWNDVASHSLKQKKKVQDRKLCNWVNWGTW